MPRKKPTYYKAVRTNGHDFHTNTVDFTTGGDILHPKPIIGDSDARNYFSVSTQLGDFPGASWPWRILEVEAVGEVWNPGGSYRNKVAVEGLRVIRELRPAAGFGPQADEIDSLVERSKALTFDDVKRLAAAGAAAGDAARAAARDAAWDAAGDAARAAARDAARAAARDAAGDAARDAAWDAAWAAAGLVVRDLIGQHGFTQEHYDLLTGPWRKAIGQLHPDDEVL